MNGYSDKVLDHFQRPRNVGAMENAHGIGEFGDAECGDFVKVFLKVEGDTVIDVKYQVRGCPASIACASAMSELAKGKNLDDAMMIVDEDIAEALGGLPEHKILVPTWAPGGLKRPLPTILRDMWSRETPGRAGHVPGF